MIHTKVYKKNGLWVLLAADTSGKYRQVFKNKSKMLVNAKRAKMQGDSIDAQQELHKRTFVNVYEEFTKEKIEDAEGPNALKLISVKHYPRIFKYWIKPYFNHRIEVQEVCIDVVEQWFKKIRKEGCGFKIAENAAASIKTCLRYARKKQYINHLNGLEDWSPRENRALLPKKAEEYQTKKTVMINRAEVKALLEHLKPKDKDIVKLHRYVAITTMTFLGLRMSELIALKWNDIDLTAGTYELHQVKVVSKLYPRLKADGSYEKNPLPSGLWNLLRNWKIIHQEYFKNSDWIFPSFKDKHISICEKTVRDWMLKAYAGIGLAEIEIIPCANKNSKSYIKVKWCKFKGAITKTLRHFAATVVTNEQASNPLIFNDNFVKGYVRHKDVKLTKGLYGNHNNLDESNSFREEQRSGLDKAFRLEV